MKQYPEDEEKLFLEDLQELVEKYNKLIDEEKKFKKKKEKEYLEKRQNKKGILIDVVLILTIL